MNQLIHANSAFYVNNIDDFKMIIRQREQRRIQFLHRSPQLSYRAGLISEIKTQCYKFKLSQQTLHLAVYLLDIFMDNHSIVRERLLLVAKVCILVAAKFEETTSKVPKISELNADSSKPSTRIEYKKMEIILFNYFDGYVMFPTAAHYIYYYTLELINDSDLIDANLTVRTLFFDLKHSINQLLDLIIQDPQFITILRPSKLAAAIIATAREKNRLKCWSKHLENLTDYKYDELKELIQILSRQ